MNQAKRVICLLLLAAAFAVPAYSEGMPPANVVVENVRTETVAQTSPFIGKVEFDKLSSVVTEVPGKILKISFTEGARVSKGDVLATVDTELLVSNMEVVKNQKGAAEAKLENSGSRLERAKSLYEKGIISRQDYEDQMYENMELGKQLDTLNSQLDNQKLVLDKSTVRAPFDGIVLERLKDVGEWIKPEEPLCTVASTADVYVSIAVPEDIVRYVLPGEQLNLRIDALGKELRGKVYGVIPVADQISRNYTVKVRVPYMANMLRNMSALVQVPVSPKRQLPVFKRAALVMNQGKQFVYTVKDGKASILPVNVVAYIGDSVAVDTPYIVAGMPVVVAGNERLMPDQAVAVAGGK